MDCLCIAGPVHILAKNQVPHLTGVACLRAGTIHSTPMIILTDNIAFAQRCIPQGNQWGNQWQACRVSTLTSPLATLAAELFQSDSIMRTEIDAGEHWDYLFAVDCARQSQFDVLSRLAVSGSELPGKTICCAASGNQFHGFKGRGWKACRGNIHLSAFVKPEREIPGAAVGFIIAGVIAALQTVASFDLQGRTPAIKWVNDILVQDAKVGGVLARLQTQGKITESAVVGIGLNVEQKPDVERDPYVPGVAALADFATTRDACGYSDVFPRLLDLLGHNLERLNQGGYAELLDIYRQHSLILNRKVTICEDTRKPSADVIASGVVESIGPSLELHLRDHPKPVSRGRLMLETIS